MEIEAICRKCGSVFTLGVLLVALTVPPGLCEHCKEHDHSPHLPHESFNSDFLATATGAASSVTGAVWLPRPNFPYGNDGLG